MTYAGGHQHLGGTIPEYENIALTNNYGFDI